MWETRWHPSFILLPANACRIAAYNVWSFIGLLWLSGVGTHTGEFLCHNTLALCEPTENDDETRTPLVAEVCISKESDKISKITKANVKA